MKYIVNGCAFSSLLTAAIAAVCICALAESGTVTTTATVIEPVKVNESLKTITTDSVVSGMTGDLVIRIATAIAASSESEGLDVSKEPETGLLNGDPVNSIDIVTIAAAPDVNAINASGASPASVNIVIAYN